VGRLEQPRGGLTALRGRSASDCGSLLASPRIPSGSTGPARCSPSSSGSSPSAFRAPIRSLGQPAHQGETRLALASIPAAGNRPRRLGRLDRVDALRPGGAAGLPAAADTRLGRTHHRGDIHADPVHRAGRPGAVPRSVSGARSVPPAANLLLSLGFEGAILMLVILGVGCRRRRSAQALDCGVARDGSRGDAASVGRGPLSVGARGGLWGACSLRYSPARHIAEPGGRTGAARRCLLCSSR
jgi:hypothetical protein